jgi:phospholipase C
MWMNTAPKDDTCWAGKPKWKSRIKATYEVIRNSALWENSLLVIVWDEAGGFYDGGAFPTQTVAPGDTAPGSEHNQNGFTFQQYGARVPAIVISPRIPRNLIDHRLYDHSSIPATLEDLFGLKPLTARDAAANRLNPLISLSAARPDAPTKLPNPAGSAAGHPASILAPQPVGIVTTVSRPQAPANDGNLPGVIHAALSQDLEVSLPQDR